jgi:hypothetical protein
MNLNSSIEDKIVVERRLIYPLKPFLNSFKFVFSEEFRNKSTNKYLELRVKEAYENNVLDNDEHDKLIDEIKHRKVDSYLNHFVYQNSAKFIIEPLKYGLLPGLTLTGKISPEDAALLWVSAGAIERTCYTIGVMTYSFFKKKEKPWFAFSIGLIPFLGGVGYLIQDIKSNSEGKVGKFLLNDSYKRVYNLLKLTSKKISENIY